MSDNSPRLDLPFILPSQAQKHVTHNEALRLLDALVQLAVEGFGAVFNVELSDEEREAARQRGKHAVGHAEPATPGAQ